MCKKRTPVLGERRTGRLIAWVKCFNFPTRLRQRNISLSESCVKKTPHFMDSKENGGPPDWLPRKRVLISRRDSDKGVLSFVWVVCRKRTPVLRTQKRADCRAIGRPGKCFNFPARLRQRNVSFFRKAYGRNLIIGLFLTPNRE